VKLALAAAVVAGAASVSAQAPPDVEAILARVGERIAEYYSRAQSVVCTEKQVVQQITRDYSPTGFARTTEYELHVESEEGSDDGHPADAKVVRELLKVNGRAPRDRDAKRPEGCTDGNPLSPEPLAFLLPAHRGEYVFSSAGPGKGRDRDTFVIEFRALKPEGQGVLAESANGHEDCFSWASPVVTRGKVWVDARTYHVVRIEQGQATAAEVKVPWELQRKHRLENHMIVERDETVIRYKRVPFNDPEETLLLPESIETLLVVRGNLESIRRQEKFSDYRRFVTAARVVK